MPNWVYNRVIPTNYAAKAFIEEWCLDDKGFTFSKLLPMPEIFKHMSSPLRHEDIVSQEEFNKFIEENKNLNLYKDYADHGFVSYINEDSWGFIQRCTAEFLPWVISKFGHCDWYYWSIDNWGCKWDASSYVPNHIDDEVWHEFNTPWCAPHQFIANLGRACPMGQFIWHWEEEQGFGASLKIEGDSVITFDQWDVPDADSIVVKLKFITGIEKERDLEVVHYKTTPFKSGCDEWLGYFCDPYDNPIEALCDNPPENEVISEIANIEEVAKFIHWMYIKDLYFTKDKVKEYVEKYKNLMTEETCTKLIDEINKLV